MVVRRIIRRADDSDGPWPDHIEQMLEFRPFRLCRCEQRRSPTSELLRDEFEDGHVLDGVCRRAPGDKAIDEPFPDEVAKRGTLRVVSLRNGKDRVAECVRPQALRYHLL